MGFIERLRQNRARRARYAQTYTELSSLNERELSDLGISRYDIPDIATRAAEGL